MSSHPMDSVPMPEGTQFIAGSNRHFAKVCGTTIAFTADQLRSERISAYEMGRNAGLEEMALAFDEEAFRTIEPNIKAMLTGMAAAFRKDKK